MIVLGLARGTFGVTRSLVRIPAMRPFIIILFAVFAASTPTPAEDLQARAHVPSPGPIPYQDPKQGLPDQQGATGEDKHSGLTQSKDVMKACLVEYGSDRFYDSWNGNYCGGFGWFKGSDGHIGSYECYQICASWLEGNGIDSGSIDYQCDVRKGINGHCWMGYHPAAAPSSTPTANPGITAMGPLATPSASVMVS